MIGIYPYIEQTAKPLDFVICPICGKGRLCDKSPNTQIQSIKNTIKIFQKANDCIVLKCPKCAHLFLLSIK